MRSVSCQARSIIAACVAMDRKFAETGAQTDHDSRMYLAWSNSLSGGSPRPAYPRRSPHSSNGHISSMYRSSRATFTNRQTCWAQPRSVPSNSI
jgi:hypothetical protein